ncbi:hypothetical protein VDG1235_2938 [Verrucomicrobiia bacterium DG1235]|nr:hypothetical protein VDG1235_2938 [Verrucomicrobiae bacterium DG1235]
MLHHGDEFLHSVFASAADAPKSEYQISRFFWRKKALLECSRA